MTWVTTILVGMLSSVSQPLLVKAPVLGSLQSVKAAPKALSSESKHSDCFVFTNHLQVLASHDVIPVTSSVPVPRTATTTWHKEQVIYFPLTDRFFDGDPSNNFSVDKNHPAGYWGGDLKGITQKLDYIKSLGASTVWLSPIADNTEQLTMGDYHGYGYHGYWISDHEKVEPSQGTMAEAENLVSEAHKKGLKVVLDVVLNHTGPDHSFLSDPSKKNWFHHQGGIVDWSDPRQVENGELGGLPDLAQENPETYDYLLKNTLEWIQKTGVDGIRLDAVKHVSKDFWAKFVPELKEKSGKEDLFVMGEVFHGDPNVVADYQKAGVDFLFDIPLYYTMKETFGEGGSFKKLGERFDQDSVYPNPDHLVTVLDNHDLPRFLSTAKNDRAGEGEQRLTQAMAFLMTARGVPSVYYGTESGFSGGEDPSNREMMDFDVRPDLKAQLAKLTSIRNHSEALQHGEQREMWRDDDVYAFSRATEKEEVIAIFNNRQDETRRHIPLRQESNLVDGTVLRDKLSGREFVVRDGHLDVTLAGLTPLILRSSSTS